MKSLIARLPHRPPFVFVTEVVAVHAEFIDAVWRVDGTEDVFRGHFPGDPIVPGVLITEALAQAAGLYLLALDTGDHGGMLVQTDVRFRKPARPPAQIELRATRTGSLGALQRFEVCAVVGESVVADGTIVLAAFAKDPIISS